MKKIATDYSLSGGNKNFTEEVGDKSISVDIIGNNLSSSSTIVKLQGSNDKENFFDLKDSQNNTLQATLNSTSQTASINTCLPYKYLRACLTVADAIGSISINSYSK